MSKTVRKFLVNDMWNIGKNESWFSHMASNGLHLKKIGPLYITFEKGEPTKTKYRMDVMNEKPSQEQLEMYRDYGWDFVTKGGLFYIFSSPEDSNSPELHTDPAEQGFTLVDLNKILKKKLIIMLIAIILIIGMYFFLYFLQDEPYLYMTNGYILQQFLVIILEIYTFYASLRSYISVQKLKNSLLEGRPINHNENWKKGRLVNTIVNMVIILASIITIIIPIMQMAKSEEYTLTDTNSNLPIIRLANIEQNKNLTHEPSFNKDGIDRSSRVQYEWSPLSPIKYIVDERGIVKEEMWDDNSGEYSPSIHTRFYELTFEKMSDGLIRDLIHRYIYEPEIEVKKMPSTEFDQLYVAQDGISKHIFASWDNNVIYIKYYGNKNIDQLLSLFYEDIK